MIHVQLPPGCLLHAFTTPLHRFKRKGNLSQIHTSPTAKYYLLDTCNVIRMQLYQSVCPVPSCSCMSFRGFSTIEGTCCLFLQQGGHQKKDIAKRYPCVEWHDSFHLTVISWHEICMSSIPVTAPQQTNPICHSSRVFCLNLMPTFSLYISNAQLQVMVMLMKQQFPLSSSQH